MKDLLSQTWLYLLTIAGTVGLGFLMLKYYTYAFSPEEFGVFSLYFSFATYLSVFISFCFGGFNILFFKEDNLTKVLSSTLFLYILSIFLVIFAVFFLEDIVVGFVKEGSESIFWCSVILAVLVSAFQLYLRVLINRQEVKSYRFTMLGQSVLNHFLSFSFIEFGLGVLGRFTGMVVAYSSFVLLAAYKGKHIISTWYKAVDDSTVRKLAFLSVPLFLSHLLSEAFIYTDRLFINSQLSLSDVGIYSFAFLLSKSVTIFAEAFSLALFPKVMQVLKSDYEEGVRLSEKLQSYFIYFILCSGLILSASSGLLVALLGNEQYQGAAQVVSIIVFSFVVGGYSKVASILLSFHEVVKFYPYVSLLTLVINLGLNYLLIPLWGISGAAYSSFVAMFMYSGCVTYIGATYQSRKARLNVITHYFLIFTLVTIWVLYFSV